jgi:hypothetical protein
MNESAQPATLYRSVSGIAILGLLLGLASPLSLISPILLVVPLAALFASLMALLRISRAEEILSGRTLAYAGLFLATFFLSYLPVRHYFRSQSLARPAQQLGDAFLELVRQKQLHAAHQLMQPRFLLRDPNRPLVEYYAGDEAAGKELKAFLESEAVEKILALDGHFDYQFESATTGTDHEGSDVLTLHYRLQPHGTTAKRPFPVWLVVVRSVDPLSNAPSWKLVEVRLSARGT